MDCTKTTFCIIAFARDWRFYCTNALKGTHPRTWTRLVVSSYYEFLISRGGGTAILRVGLIARGTVVATVVDFIAVNSAIAVGIITVRPTSRYVSFGGKNSRQSYESP